MARHRVGEWLPFGCSRRLTPAQKDLNVPPSRDIRALSHSPGSRMQPQQASAQLHAYRGPPQPSTSAVPEQQSSRFAPCSHIYVPPLSRILNPPPSTPCTNTQTHTHTHTRVHIHTHSSSVTLRIVAPFAIERQLFPLQQLSARAPLRSLVHEPKQLHLQPRAPPM